MWALAVDVDRVSVSVDAPAAAARDSAAEAPSDAEGVLFARGGALGGVFCPPAVPVASAPATIAHPSKAVRPRVPDMLPPSLDSPESRARPSINTPLNARAAFDRAQA